MDRRLALVVALLFAPFATSSSQTVSDSLARGLDSLDISARYNAVTSLENLPTSQISSVVRSRLIALLEAEGDTLLRNAVLPSLADTTDYGELYPEYVSDLTQVVLSLQDARALRGLCLAGLQVNGEVQQFVTAHANDALPFLQEAWQNPTLHEGVFETWGRILGTPSAPVSMDQRNSIMASVMRAASSDPLGFLWAADFGGLAVAASVAASIASTSFDDVVRERASAVQVALAEEQQAKSSVQILTETEAWLDAVCAGSTGARNGACRSTGNALKNAQKALGHPGRAASVQLGNAIDHATSARDRGLFSTAEAALVIGNAGLVLGRL